MSARSPAVCPNRSLNSLNQSRSRSRIESARPVRAERSSSAAKRSSRTRRLASPVSESLRAAAAELLQEQCDLLAQSGHHRGGDQDRSGGHDPVERGERHVAPCEDHDRVHGAGEERMAGGDDPFEEVGTGQHHPEQEEGVGRDRWSTGEVRDQPDHRGADRRRHAVRPERQPIEADQEDERDRIGRDRHAHQDREVAVGRVGKRERRRKQRPPDPKEVRVRARHGGAVLEHRHGSDPPPCEAAEKNAALGCEAVWERGFAHQ